MKVSHFAPDGDKRLTLNIKRELHLKLRMASVMAGITMGELVEKFIKDQLDDMLRKGSR